MMTQRRGRGTPRDLVLEYVPRRDAAQRLRLAFCLLSRELGSSLEPQTALAHEGASGDVCALTRAAASVGKEGNP
jgi:hypothetical protein